MNHLDALEQRAHLAGDFATVTSRGTLIVLGTSRNNLITVSASGGSEIVVRRDKARVVFDAADIRRVRVEGFRGDDRITNQTNRIATLLGAAGDDLLVGAFAPETLNGGTGDDRLVPGNVGRNLLDGGGGGDDLYDYSAVSGTHFAFKQRHSSANPAGVPGLLVSLGDYDDVYADETQADELIPGPRVRWLGTPANDRIVGVVDYPLIIDGNAGNDTIAASQQPSADPDAPALAAVVTLVGGAGNDVLSPFIDGRLAAVYGGAGDDDIVGGLESSMFGEGGDDTLYSMSVDRCFIDGGEGTDTECFNVHTGAAVVVLNVEQRDEGGSS